MLKKRKKPLKRASSQQRKAPLWRFRLRRRCYRKACRASMLEERSAIAPEA